MTQHEQNTPSPEPTLRVTDLHVEAAKLALVKYSVLMPTDAAIRDMLAAAASVGGALTPSPAPNPRVKPLRWKGPDSSGECHSLDGLWGYIIRPGNGNGYWMTEVGGYYATPEAAQQAANEDYERRILSALAATTEGSTDA